MANQMTESFVESEGHCFLCLEPVIRVKLEPVSVFDYRHSLQYLFHYLKLDLGRAAVLSDEDITASQPSLKAKLKTSRFRVELCEGCGALNGQFSELYQQLEKIQMQDTHCLGVIHKKLTRGSEREASLEPASDNFLDKREVEVLEALREEAMQMCSSKLKQATPRVKIHKLAYNEDNLKLQLQVEMGAASTSTSQDVTTEAKPVATLTAKTEVDSDSEAAPQLGMQLTNMDSLVVEKEDVLKLDLEENTGHSSSGTSTSDDENDPDHDPSKAELDEDQVSSDETGKSESPPLSPSELPGSSVKTRFKRSPTTGKFKCPACSKEFLKQAVAERHYQSIHLKLKNLTCKICGMKFIHRTHLTRHHKTIHLQLKPHKCDDCGQSFGTTDKLQRHHQNVHLKPGLCKKAVKIPLAPPKRKKPVSSKTTLRRSTFIHNPQTGKFKCPECEKEYPTRSKTNLHHQSVHLKLKSVCDICGKGFSRPDKLLRHKQVVHLKLKPKAHLCNDCGKQFVCKDRLNRHQKNVHLKIRPRYDCTRCGKQFSQQEKLTHHNDVVHLKLKRFQCDHCGQSFTESYSLKLHVESIHQKIRHVCDQCGKTFGRQKDLRSHCGKFHLKLDHECDLCGKGFRKESNLQLHYKFVHSRFRCESCKEDFLSEKDLKAHSSDSCGAIQTVQNQDPIAPNVDCAS